MKSWIKIIIWILIIWFICYVGYAYWLYEKGITTTIRTCTATNYSYNFTDTLNKLNNLKLNPWKKSLKM